MTAQTVAIAAPAQPVSAWGLMHRLLDQLLSVTYTVELDPHLARDIGRASYQAPLFGARQGGGGRE